MKKYLLGIAGILALIVVVVIIRAINFKPEQVEVADQAPITVTIDADQAARHLSEAIRIKTISPQPPIERDKAEFEKFIAWVHDSYPLVAQNLTMQRINEHTMLFKWLGTDTEEQPILLTAHYDVVPVVPGSEGDWTHPPFAGDIVDGIIWGRGSLDDKSAVVAYLEAVEALLAEGFNPGRTIYLSFGHDEEIGGPEGAHGVAEYFLSHGIQAAWSLDEGSFVLDGFYPGVDVPFATINVAEKGYLTLQLTAHAQGGHSSMPPKETAVGILSEAIVKLQNNRPEAKLDGPGAKNFENAARYMSFGKRVLFANQWLFGSLIRDTLAKDKLANAQLRTTTAPTMLSGSIKENVLPIEAIGIVNFRLHPRDTIESTVKHVKKTINDPRIDVEIINIHHEASAIASTESEAYKALSNEILRVFGSGVAISEGMTVGGTDSASYSQVADNSYRFNPMIITRQDFAGFHGTNESLSVDNLHKAAIFYAELIKDTASPQAHTSQEAAE